MTFDKAWWSGQFMGNWSSPCYSHNNLSVDKKKVNVPSHTQDEGNYNNEDFRWNV